MQKSFFTCFVLYLFFNSLSVFAQVGINTTNPHTSAALDITSSTKGLLIPRIDSAARVGMKGMANSLLVFDTTKQLFFYYQASNNAWYTLNAWQSSIIENGNNTDTLTTTFSQVGIGTNTPTKKLDVVGNIGATTTITAGQSVSAPKIYGEGTMPVGAIIMWSGDPATLPVGWALCDGQIPPGQTVATPNLKGRFVVGFDPADTDYNATKKVGPAFTDADGTSTGANTTDAKQVRPNGAQSGVGAHTHDIDDPGHSHSFSDIYNHGQTVGQNGGANGEWAGSSGTTLAPNTTFGSGTNVTIRSSQPSDASQSIENRPPYYVLAYIIKLAY